jgi:hypothetical protein
MRRVKDHRTLLLTLLVAALATSCSNGDDGPQAKFVACMRQHGIKMPDPGPSGQVPITGGPPQRIQAALRACQRFQTAARTG